MAAPYGVRKPVGQFGAVAGRYGVGPAIGHGADGNAAVAVERINGIDGGDGLGIADVGHHTEDLNLAPLLQDVGHPDGGDVVPVERQIGIDNDVGYGPARRSSSWGRGDRSAGGHHREGGDDGDGRPPPCWSGPVGPGVHVDRQGSTTRGSGPSRRPLASGAEHDDDQLSPEPFPDHRTPALVRLVRSSREKGGRGLDQTSRLRSLRLSGIWQDGLER